MTTSALPDSALISEVKRLARCEREAAAALICHLAELYRRRLHERAGFTSLFLYCVVELRLSESAAYDRMKAAKVARRYPMVMELIESGRVNLTTVRLLAPHLTRANYEGLFSAAEGLGKRQVQVLLAERFPKPDVASTVRKLPAPREDSSRKPDLVAPVNVVAPPAVSIPAPPRELVQPLSPDRYQVTFTASTSACEKLAFAQDLLRHAVPTGDPAAIFERALEALVEKLVKEKFAATPQPRTSRGQADDSRHIPAEVKRAVYARDRGRCAFIAATGRRCGERGFVEFHHVAPYGAGGSPTTQNISLRCRAHNDYESESFYGPGRQYGGIDIARERRRTYAVSGMTRFRSGTKTTAPS